MCSHPLRPFAGFSAAVLVAALAFVVCPASGLAQSPMLNAERPCVGLAGAPPRVDHVIVLFMENHSYSKIIGSARAPYVNGLARRCGLAMNYHNITHPSAPEYLAATSGALGGAGDCPPVHIQGYPPKCPDGHENIFTQAMAAGETWKDYEESMATNCLEGEGGTYDINHNPAAYYTHLGGPSGNPSSPCAQFDVPMGTPQGGTLENDLTDGTLPNYSFIAPNLRNDTHNSTVAVGDRYLSELIPTILDSPEYESGSTVLFVAWDEGEGGSTNNCAFNTTDIGCHVAMIVVSPYTQPGTSSSALFNHYSLFKTSEQLLGLPLIGASKDPRVESMAAAFDL